MIFERATDAIGAQVSGLDLAQELTPETVDVLRRAVHNYGVLFFRDQHLTPDTHKVLGSHFGDLHRHSLIPSSGEFFVLDSAEVVAAFPSGTAPGSTGWHSDATFEEHPPETAILRPVVLPSVGGDTLWSSMYSVYESFSGPVQRLLEELDAHHGLTPQLSSRAAARGAQHDTSASAVHPLVFTDPVTERKAIYANSNYTLAIVGLPPDESQAILRMIFDAIKAPEHQVRFRWTHDAVAIWNEQVTQHCGVGGYRGRRVMNRVIAGRATPSRDLTRSPASRTNSTTELDSK